MPFSPDTQRLARQALDAIAPDAKPKPAKPEANPIAVALRRPGSLKESALRN
jgi:hypothetical protein